MRLRGLFQLFRRLRRSDVDSAFLTFDSGEKKLKCHSGFAAIWWAVERASSGKMAGGRALSRQRIYFRALRLRRCSSFIIGCSSFMSANSGLQGVNRVLHRPFEPGSLIGHFYEVVASSKGSRSIIPANHASRLGFKTGPVRSCRLAWRRRNGRSLSSARHRSPA